MCSIMEVYYVVWIRPSGEELLDPWAFHSSVDAIVQAFRVQALSGVIEEFEIRRDELGLAGSGPIKLAA